jgi:3-dehydroquinate synthase
MTDARVDSVGIEHGSGAYTAVIRPGLLDVAGELLAPHVRNGRCIIVSDSNVWQAQGGRIGLALRHSGVDPVTIVIPAGEASKSWGSLIELTDRLIDLGVERGENLVAFGGGVIGDLAGFASAILKRGCGYVQVPTSLLAQVDSSVGGKTGINVAAGKNLIGAFHQPAAVFIDPTCLGTLPERHLRAGYAEIAKYALIGDSSFFDWCERSGAALIGGDVSLRVHAIGTSIRTKAAIVEGDELETKGKRMLLNFGHTFGHAYEAAAGFGEALLHGEAIALGMALAFRMSADRGLCTAEEADRVGRHLADVGLPTDPAQLGLDIAGSELVRLMRHDKKARNGRLPLILTRGIGRAFADDNVRADELTAFLDAQLSR